MLGIYCRTSKDSETIEQQKEAGIRFCMSHNFDYKIYEDKGISGFKISDDDANPFKNRPSFLSLINDIRSLKITQVWVSKHDRWSRNTYASAIIFNIFEKFNIEVFEKNIKLDLKDPKYKLLRQMMDNIAEYERSLIVGRTTEGLYNAINKGNRGYAKFFGYKKVGKDTNGKSIWKPVDVEIEDLKYMYKRFLEGVSLRNIVFELYEEQKSNSKLLRLATKISRFLKHCEYTGYVLNMEGLDILHRYDKFEIENISILQDRKYWVKSIPYPQQIISIENWIKCKERLHYNRVIKKDNTRKAWKDLATGIITCPICGSRYYSYITKYKNHKTGDYNYNYYKHFAGINNNHCSQKPKTIQVGKINEFLKAYFFFYYLVYNKSNTFIKESLEKMRHQKQTLETKVKSNESEIAKIRKQLIKFKDLLLEVENANSLRIATDRIDMAEIELEEKITNVTEMKIELEKINQKYSKTELENTYTNIKDKILNFYSMDIEDQRTDLMVIIKKCFLFGNYLLIDTGRLIFIFDTRINYKFDKSLLQDLERDRVYKNYFIKSTFRKKSGFFETVTNISIMERDNKPKYLFTEISDNKEAENILKKLKIKYNIEKISKLIFLNG
jgi:site-specific DNA recombinase